MSAGQTGVISEADERDGNTMYWTDYATGHTRLITRSNWWNAGVYQTDRWIVWAEQDRIQSTETLEPVAWRIRGERVGETRPRTLIASRHRARVTPDFVVRNDTLFYTTYHGITRGTVDIRQRDLVTGKDTLFLPDVAAGLVGYDGKRFLAEITTNRGNSPDETTSDLFIVTDKPWTRVSHGGNPGDVRLTNDALLWEDCGLERCTTRVTRWPSLTDERVLTKDQERGQFPDLGDGFFTTQSNIGGLAADVFAAPLGKPDAEIWLHEPENEYLDAIPSASGNHVVWTTTRGRDQEKPGSLVIVTLEAS